MHKVTLSSKGQVVIPAAIRHELNLKSGTVLHVFSSGKKVVLIPEAQDPIQEGLGLLSRSTKENVKA